MWTLPEKKDIVKKNINDATPIIGKNTVLKYILIILLGIDKSNIIVAIFRYFSTVDTLYSIEIPPLIYNC